MKYDKMLNMEDDYLECTILRSLVLRMFENFLKKIFLSPNLTQRKDNS